MDHDDLHHGTGKRRESIRCGMLRALLLGSALACGERERTAARDDAPSPANAAASVAGAPDAHTHAAPHGGVLVELGEEFAHVELVLDAASGRLTAYALDGEAEGAIPLTQREIRVVLTAIDARPDSVDVVLVGQANALSGETVERTSVFAAVVPELTGASAFAGRLVAVEAKGERFEAVPFQGAPPVRGGG
jgi:hypothetical protein